MKVKFRSIKDRVSKNEQEGLAQYHQKFGGTESIKLLALRSRFNNGRAVSLRSKSNNRRITQ